MRNAGKWERVMVVLLAFAFGCSAAFNGYLLHKGMGGELWNIHFPDANLRETYDSMHHVKEAHKVSTGAGIRVGILDWCFGYEEHEGLYAGGKDFTVFEDHEEAFNHASEHGYWMAQTLREIAPGVEIYALGTYDPDSEKEWVDALVEAIRWAEEQEIDILTLSHQAISAENRGRLDEAVNEAIGKGIVTTFIHYDNPGNILPWGIWDSSGDGYYNRDADINIFQYDYNTLFTNDYLSIAEEPDYNEIYKGQLYTSVSSMSVVTAGFVAILMEIDDSLTPAQYKEILIRTSYPAEYEGERAEHVADIDAAVQYLAGNII